MKRIDCAIEDVTGLKVRFRDRILIYRKCCATVTFLETDIVLFRKRFLISIRLSR